MDRIRHFADLSIRRACGFGFLAIGTMAIGASWDSRLAVKTAAIGVTLMASILVWKAFQAPGRNYRDTEVFLLMDQRHDFPEARAQQVFGNVLRERYLWHATMMALTAFMLWLAFGLLLFLGPPALD
jgi:hypothetical protein